MRIPIATALLLQLGLLSSYTQALTNPVCNYKMFPVFAGGSRDEHVKTQEVDPITEQIFVGGYTESSNFAPAENAHGFVYSLSQDGNWMWGQFFYNVSYAVSRVDAIKMTSNNTNLVVLGQANSKPIIMTLNKNDG